MTARCLVLRSYGEVGAARIWRVRGYRLADEAPSRADGSVGSYGFESHSLSTCSMSVKIGPDSQEPRK